MSTSPQAQPNDSTPLKVAVVGSGPSGCFFAQMLRKQRPDAHITVFDRLPVPFGLVRYGVAPDHQHTKRIVDRFTRVFEDERTAFAGNVEIGRDVSVDELRANFHVVIIAAGISGDRVLSIPGENLPGVYGAGQVMRWINAHPDEVNFSPDFGRETVIVGSGNVAIDVLRTLVKDETGFVGSDLPDAAFACLERSRPRKIHVVGRSSADRAKFDAAMIRELAALEHVSFDVDGLDSETQPEEVSSKVRTLRALAENHRPEAEVEVSFHFGWSPAEVHGADRVKAMTFCRGKDGKETLRLSTDSIVTAIGFTGDPGDALSNYSTVLEATDAERGRIAEGIYSCGWFRRGATGGIPANRACAKEVVSYVVADIDADHLKYRPGINGLNEQVKAKAVDFSDWKKIDAQETAGADDRRIRRKLKDIETMLAAAEHRLERHQHGMASTSDDVPHGATTLVMGI